MALPKLNTPTYELEIPSTDEKIKFRPFLVKEEKILMMALETKDNAQIVNAVKDIVSECTYNKLNINTMPMFDVEYIFLQIRSKSVGEVSKVKILCPDDKKTYTNVEIDLNEVKVQVEDEHTNKIELKWIIYSYSNFPEPKSFFKEGFYRIAGTKKLKTQIEEGLSEKEIRRSWEEGLTNFRGTRLKYLLY